MYGYHGKLVTLGDLVLKNKVIYYITYIYIFKKSLDSMKLYYHELKKMVNLFNGITRNVMVKVLSS